MNELEVHDAFAKKMAAEFPRYFGDECRYGGFAIGEGWYPIIAALVGQIDHYTKWQRNRRAHDLRKQRAKNKGLGAMIKFIARGKEPTHWDIERAEEEMKYDDKVMPKVEWIRIAQIKEKFGGLRFYYDGGDDYIAGMVNMAESWAGHTCEKCGNVGKQRSGGWIRTLCDAHEAEYQARTAKMRSEDE